MQLEVPTSGLGIKRARPCRTSSSRSSPPTRRAGLGPRPGDRARARRADAGPADRRLAARARRRSPSCCPHEARRRAARGPRAGWSPAAAAADDSEPARRRDGERVDAGDAHDGVEVVARPAARRLRPDGDLPARRAERRDDHLAVRRQPRASATRRRDGSAGVGSGFVLNDKGEIATNAHVVTDGEGDRSSRRAQVYVRVRRRQPGRRRRSSASTRTPTSPCSRSTRTACTLRPLPLGDSRTSRSASRSPRSAPRSARRSRSRSASCRPPTARSTR